MVALRPLSLRSRLIAGIALVAAVLIAVSIIVTSTTREQLLSQVDSRLNSIAFRPPDGRPVDPADGRPALPVPAAPPIGRERASDVYEGVVDDAGVLVDIFLPNVADDVGPPAIDATDLPDVGSSTFTVGSVGGGATYRVLAQRTDRVVVITATPIDDVERTIDRLVIVEILGSLAILTALGLVGWWVVHLGIRPIKRMTQTASRIADGDLTVRVEPARPGTEAGELAGALNRMLGHIGDAFDERAASEDRLRQFVADASHELRTPVTTIRGYAELYRHGGLADPAQLDDAMRRTEAESARMSRLIEDMLTLAKLDEQRPIAATPVDLAAIADDAAADARAVAPERTITAEISGPVVIRGDDDRIRQVVANVVGNALVHTAADVPITISVHADGSMASISVHDEGDGMPSGIAERVTERFFRADPARARHRGGSGLGLSIVEATVAAHGGSVEIDSTEGAGTTVRLSLPLEP